MRAHAPLGLLLLTLTACSANVSSPGESDADAVRETTAVVTFERITTNGPTGETQVRGAAAARFVQSRSAAPALLPDDRALKLVGAAFDSPPSFGCVALSDEVDSASGRALELADVGALSVVQTAPASSASATNPAPHAFALVPRQVPDPVGLVGGVLYYAPSTELSQVAPGARYAVRAAGSPGVPSFELSGTSPFEIADVRIAGQPSQGRAVLSATQGVDIAWTTPDPARDSGDVFFVDLVIQRPAGTFGTSSTLRCAADAFGASIPGPALSSGAEETNGTIAIHRVHREQRARSSVGSSHGPLESSELRFDFSRVIAFTRR